MNWSEYFHAYMLMPGTIEESVLLSGSSVIATDASENFLDANAIELVWQRTFPKDSVMISGSKYLYIKDIVGGQDGYSISLYQKVKSEGASEEGPNILFVAEMDTLLWVGNFNNNQKAQVIPFVESIASHIFTHIVQSEE
ncbi:hypothetical protein NEMIN01_0593 [Nematocida minor]|uniref:uncharacterized protein n=1 Tax=Nematocida minor TaxID=1912983 RepID=UPI00221E4281|nr:uncharacterized protein NEMIN01_0593 [Nematocida minor]KAI5189640.1 hypothetical protein NEMIN01_0593 [Nematocida minor]